MPAGNRFRHVLFASCIVAALICPAETFAEPADEYAAKAAFIYNLALFSTFPETSQGTIPMCVLGRDPFGPALGSIEGKPVGVAKLTVRHPKTSAEAIRQCRILFISASEGDNVTAIADSARDAGILTVADTRGAARKGVMVELGIEDKRISFEFNNESARAANIGVSSKVLRLAKAVH